MRCASGFQTAEQATACSLGWSAAEPQEWIVIKPAKPAKWAAACCDQLISFGIRRISVACFAGLDDLDGAFPGVPLRSTPGFILSPAFAG